MKTPATAVLLCFCVTALASAQDIEVVSADVAWMTDKGERFVRGMRLAGDTQLQTDGAGDLLLKCPRALQRPVQRLHHCRGSACKVKACDAVSSDNPPTGDLTTRDLPDGLFPSLSALFTREPKVVLAAARVGGNPSDAVLLMDGRGLHAGPALARVLEGRYCLLLGELPHGAPSAVQTVTIDWDRATDSEGIVPAPGLRPGLYALDKGTPSPGGGCQTDSDDATAWVFIASDPDFERARSEWNQHGATITRIERDGASRLTVATIRHSVLAGLAQSTR